MRLLKGNVTRSQKEEALKLMNSLKAGNRVFGNPAEGLKKTLKGLEQRLADMESNRGKLDYLANDGEILTDIRLVKAGIKGEEGLAEWLERIVKYDPVLQDLIVFASLSDPEQNSGGDEYISDSDFLAVYGRHVLILDAKNIRTSPDVPIYLDGDQLVTVGGQPLLDLHPSVHVWNRLFDREGVYTLSVHGCVVIVNDSGAVVWKNQQWHRSEVKPVHISELVDFLHQWVEGKDPEVDLSMLVSIANMQIRTEGTDLDLRGAAKRFGV